MSGPANDAESAGPGRDGRWRPSLAPPINHLLKSASWARARLRPFAGKTARFNLPLFVVTLAIRDSGEVEDSPTVDIADASFTLTPGVALRMMAGDPHAWQQVEATGDTELAREILAVAQNLRWEVEEDLSRVVGDIAAHRLVQAGGELRRWHLQAADSLARTTIAYWTEEQPLIATRQDVENFLRDVDTLSDDVARTEKRIDHLAAKSGRH